MVETGRRGYSRVCLIAELLKMVGWVGGERRGMGCGMRNSVVWVCEDEGGEGGGGGWGGRKEGGRGERHEGLNFDRWDGGGLFCGTSAVYHLHFLLSHSHFLTHSNPPLSLSLSLSPFLSPSLPPPPPGGSLGSR